jgi:hypothetical protein
MTATTRLIIERNVRVRMSDGVELAADVFRPDTTERLPVLLERTPYDRGLVPVAGLNWIALAEAGYAIVVQDCRGRFGSGGTFRPFLDEARDGAETIGWAASQPWSNGVVGMIGGSYVGATQWLPAGSAPRALRAIAPYVTSSDYHEGWVYQGGAFQLGFSLRWSLESLALPALLARQAAGESLDAEIAELYEAIDHIALLYRHRPLRGIPLMDRFAPWYDEWLRHPERDAFWTNLSPQERYPATAVPALHIGGWYDIFIDGTIRNYAGMRATGADERARRGQRLLVGPWSHAVNDGLFPERRYGTLSGLGAQDPTTLHRRFFDHELKGIDNGWQHEAPAQVFVMGANEWHAEAAWPPVDAEVRAFYLRGDRPANTASGAGHLSLEPPGHEPGDVFLYDPRDPVPTMGGATLNQVGTAGWNSGPWDQRGVESRQDVLCYTTEPLARSVEVAGSVEAVLFVTSSARDTDFTAKLVDVHPDGRAENIADGIVRARYRESLATPKLLESGRVVELRILVGATAACFRVGHRIRLDVSSSNFPRFDANTNTGGVIADDGPEAIVPALNRVFHDSTHPSRLLLPVVERA